VDDVVAQINQHGFSVHEASHPLPAIGKLISTGSWGTFAASWANMPRDTYMADGGTYRRRRFRVFEATGEGIVLAPHQPHFQTTEHNHLNGGIERWFEPIPEAIATGPVMTGLITLCQAAFAALAPQVQRWQVETHQFRIEADGGTAGNPTPEGMHRDGVDYVLVLLVTRQNIASGTTTLADEQKRPLGAFTLTKPGDCVLLDDHRVYHGVTSVVAVDPTKPAYRDVLVMTFRNAAAAVAG
jgi:hypothetical protein